MEHIKVAKRLFRLWKLEYWWIVFGDPRFFPIGRSCISIHKDHGWFWRN